ncbi:hypothetical protein FHS88_000184 [Roseomonas alkaliterrae]|uniref:Uncharacterized protein n=1 Tax=Neoroseomonas alkaliterrae TaxID=1452450 RepID=A0A840Y2H1_9PROT|nr:hypothetical protein [Neoroseomonas alkaliterrae]
MHAPHVAEFEITPGFLLAPRDAGPQTSGAWLLTGTRCRVALPAHAAPAASTDASAVRPTPGAASMPGNRPA